LVYLKNSLKIIFALTTAFVLVELFTLKLLGFPKWGVEKQVFGLKPYGKKIYEIYKPHSEYFNTENGYKVFKRNNFGLQGIDIDTSVNHNFIFLLGDSYTQAAETEPVKMASSIFQELSSEYKISVFNIGSGGKDPYYSFFLSLYYKQLYTPKLVILTIAQSYSDWLDSRYKSLDFRVPEHFGETSKSWKFADKEISLCNTSSLISLLDMALKNSLIAINKNTSDKAYQENLKISGKLYDCFTGYKNEYGDKFILVSISSDNIFNANIREFSNNNGIKFYYKQLNIPENKINGKGHFNDKGNSEYGEFLYSILKQEYAAFKTATIKAND